MTSAGRPADPDRRARVLAAATDLVLERGWDDLTLRPLAAALGTSTRMLLYDFGSKDALLAALLESVRARQAEVVAAVYDGRSSSREAVRTLWTWLIDPAHAGYVRLHAKVRLLSASGEFERPDPQAGLSALGQRTDSEAVDLVVIGTLLHALALRRLGEADPGLTDAAFEHFLGVIRE